MARVREARRQSVRYPYRDVTQMPSFGQVDLALSLGYSALLLVFLGLSLLALLRHKTRH
jgi:hypothetical protein